jgi:hypothetical protein
MFFLKQQGSEKSAAQRPICDFPAPSKPCKRSGVHARVHRIDKQRIGQAKFFRPWKKRC